MSNSEKVLEKISGVTTEWINGKMHEYGLKRKDLTAEIGIDKSYLSLLFAKPENPRKIQLSKPMKAMFFYYFLSKELKK
ncbi:hypothetical protein [Bergeyella zoohelcum]|uniref:HTH cro/C1-type domain-containing protein n=1 Tax=Bergeyella zoohelcum TaxID=1015 RepID=A0A7Z9CGF0_9FLAO|nr:hypothetical protein [Bergeyella zoohelcum]VDH04943.1 Uncharacterised protein [Bergeyella zoohelcum]